MFRRYKAGDPTISAADMNARARALESLQQLTNPRSSGGLLGFAGVVNAMRGMPFFPLLVPGKITARSTGSPALPPAVNYKARSVDKAWEITTFAAPLFRPYNDIPQVLPAELDSDCLLLLVPKPAAGGFDVKLFFVVEKLNFEACASSVAPYTFGPGSIDLEGIIVADDFSLLVTEAHELVVADSWPEPVLQPENEVIIGEDMQPLVGADADVVVADQSLSLLVDPSFFAPLLTSEAGLVVVASSAALSTLPPAAPADDEPIEESGGGGDAAANRLTDLDDAETTSPVAGDVLFYTGSMWVNVAGLSLFAAAGHEHEQKITAGSDVSTTSATNVNATGLSYSLAANEEIHIKGYIRHVSIATGIGLSLGFTHPAGCSTSFTWLGPGTTSAGQVKGSVVADTVSAQAGTISTTDPQLSIFEAWVRNGATPGTWQLRFCSETAGQQVTIKGESYMKVRAP